MNQHARAGTQKHSPPARQLSDNEREQLAKGYTLDRIRRVEATAQANRSAIPAATKDEHGVAASPVTVFAVLKQFASHTDDSGFTFAKPALVGRECLLSNGGKTVAAVTRALRDAGLLVPTSMRRYGRDQEALYVPWTVGESAGHTPSTHKTMQKRGPAGGPTGGPAWGLENPVSPGEGMCESDKAEGGGRKPDDFLQPRLTEARSADATRTSDRRSPDDENDLALAPDVAGESPADPDPRVVGPVDPAAAEFEGFLKWSAHFAAFGENYRGRTFNIRPANEEHNELFIRVAGMFIGPEYELDLADPEYPGLKVTLTDPEDIKATAANILGDLEILFDVEKEEQSR